MLMTANLPQYMPAQRYDVDGYTILTQSLSSTAVFPEDFVYIRVRDWIVLNTLYDRKGPRGFGMLALIYPKHENDIMMMKAIYFIFTVITLITL